MSGGRVGQVPRVRAVVPGGPGLDGEVVEVLLQARRCSGREVALLVDWCGRDSIRKSEEDGTNLNEDLYLAQLFTSGDFFNLQSLPTKVDAMMQVFFCFNFFEI